MKSLKKKRRIQLVLLSFVFLLAAAALIGVGFKDGINLYRSPSQLAENPPAIGEVFRLGGMVEEGSLIRNEGDTISFRVTDGGDSVGVRFTGVPPDLFGESQGMIAIGSMEGDVFVAKEILAKHDENYMPREIADSLKEQGMYQDSNS